MSQSIFYIPQLPVYSNYRKSTLHVLFPPSLSLSSLFSITVSHTRPFLCSNTSGNRWEFSSAFLSEEKENEEINTHSKSIYVHVQREERRNQLIVCASENTCVPDMVCLVLKKASDQN